VWIKSPPPNAKTPSQGIDAGGRKTAKEMPGPRPPALDRATKNPRACERGPTSKKQREFFWIIVGPLMNRTNANLLFHRPGVKPDFSRKRD